MLENMGGAPFLFVAIVTAQLLPGTNEIPNAMRRAQ